MKTKLPKWLQGIKYLADQNKDPVNFQSQIEHASRVLEAAKDPEMCASWDKGFRGRPPSNKTPEGYARRWLEFAWGMNHVLRAAQITALTIDMEANRDEVSDWLEKNRHNLTADDIEGMAWTAARLHGKSEYMKEVQSPRKERAQEKNDEITNLWLPLKAKGMSKNEAAKKIALKVHQSEKTVRGKLKKPQGG